MNRFLQSTLRVLSLHGKSATYTAVAEGSYNVETGSASNTETNYTVVMYKRHINANEYNYPDLIGKTSAIFYLANNALAFTPATRDKITFSGETFVITSITEHAAAGQVVLYKLVGVKG